MRIGRYELFGPFATGGMASVHLGKLFASGGFQRIVAIKVPHVQFIRDPAFRAMFLDEARIVARIHSPHVVATLDILEEGETLYQVMEYANGPSLSSVLKATRAHGEPLPLPLVLTLVVDVLEGLHAAHESVDDRGAPLNVVHRDVSPQNILVNDDGVAKVLDFGIASATGKLHLTLPGDVKGKISYMAPEQVEARPVDHRADIYAVGIVLYEVLTGQKPFTGQDFASTALMHLLNAAPDPRALRPDIPGGLAAIIARALEKKPQDRFPSARSMADALLILPIRRAPPREVAEWLADTSREFFVEREALIAGLPSLEEVNRTPDIRADRPSPVEDRTPEEAPTRAELGASRSKRSARANTGAQGAASPVARRVGLGIILVLGVTGGVLATVHSARRPTAALGAMASALPRLQPAPTPTASAAEARSAEPEASPSSVVAPVAHARPRADRPNTAAKAAAAPSSSNTPAETPCCSGDLRIRLTNCLNNCPSGT